MKTRRKMTKAFNVVILLGDLVLFGLTHAVHAQEVEGMFLGNMGFKFTPPGGKIILTDPWPRVFGLSAAVSGHVDLILVSGAHFDNLGDTVAIAKNTGATVIATPELSAWIISQGVPETQVFSMLQSGLCGKPDELNDPCDLVGISVKVVQAVHTAGIDTGSAPQGYGGESVGFIITFENGLRLYFSGDTGLFGDMKLIGELYKPHVAILSAAGRFMLEPEDAALATKFLRTQNKHGHDRLCWRTPTSPLWELSRDTTSHAGCKIGWRPVMPVPEG
jgi:L-ascorbate metabolism protein UlaG (beta-lactamase superfamily)